MRKIFALVTVGVFLGLMSTISYYWDSLSGWPSPVINEMSRLEQTVLQEIVKIPLPASADTTKDTVYQGGKLSSSKGYPGLNQQLVDGQAERIIPLDPERVKKLAEQVTLSDRAKVATIITKSLTYQDMMTMKDMTSGGITAEEKQQVKDMLGSRITPEEIDEIKAIYRKYAQ